MLENDCFFCARPSCFLSCGPLSVSPLPPSLLTSLPAHTAEQQVPAACDSAVCWLYTSVYIHECSLIRGFQKEEIGSLHKRATQYFLYSWNWDLEQKQCHQRMYRAYSAVCIWGYNFSPCRFLSCLVLCWICTVFRPLCCWHGTNDFPYTATGMTVKKWLVSEFILPVHCCFRLVFVAKFNCFAKL